ncbi:tyrosine--tRNA ligase, mitochondrial [Anthonomus grandis grandis]|uniref:tyrosine--tRNA ligase, mitochondrial n=1 Tax=Anthonomus grandis grandis TaxID=2921223 RepID=UPI002166ADA9|nr:tyrosine--tRNA ligase, mitochondrial [Anthonomus grandis grandis]
MLKNPLKTQIFTFIYRNYSNRNILKLKERGMLEDIFPDNAANSVTDLLNASSQTVYAGFDPTASSLHVGNLLVLVNLIHWQRGGHQPIALVGGATGKIGDPSGRSTERDEMKRAIIDENVKGIRKNIETVFENHQKYLWKERDSLKPVRIVNNEEWYSQISAVDLISQVGRYLRMGTLLSRHSVQSRLKSPQGMSFTEFSYQLFQAYDWMYLFKHYNCTFQIGGNDQMGNIMSGHELISKAYDKPVYGLTVPLVTTEMGDKFGKSAGNAVWLTADKTSPFSLYQFWIRQPDSEIEKMLKLFTFESVGAISDLMRRHSESPESRIPHTVLAEQVTLLVHGPEGLKKAQKASEVLYKGNMKALGYMDISDIVNLFEGATVVEILPEAGQSVLDVSLKAGCFATEADAIRIISAGGFKINQQKVRNPSEIINANAHILENKISVLRVGKRHYYIVKWMF